MLKRLMELRRKVTDLRGKLQLRKLRLGKAVEHLTKLQGLGKKPLQPAPLDKGLRKEEHPQANPSSLPKT
jgi:hypothetical protein